MTNTDSPNDDGSAQMQSPAAMAEKPAGLPASPPGTEGADGRAAGGDKTGSNGNNAGESAARDLEAIGEPEKFIPLTRYAILNKMTEPRLWNNGEAGDAERFFRYLNRVFKFH